MDVDRINRRHHPDPPRTRFTESPAGVLLTTFSAGLLLGLILHDIAGLLDHPTNLENAMDLNINGHDAIDQMGGAFDPAHPADGHGDDVERQAAADAPQS